MVSHACLQWPAGLHGVFWSVYRRCWVHNAGEIEWIIYVPILFCIAVSMAYIP